MPEAKRDFSADYNLSFQPGGDKRSDHYDSSVVMIPAIGIIWRLPVNRAVLSHLAPVRSGQWIFYEIS